MTTALLILGICVLYRVLNRAENRKGIRWGKR